MKMIQAIILSIVFFATGCSFSTKKDEASKEVQNYDVLNIYAENAKGGYMLIQTNKDGDAYFKMRGANYANHYFGKLDKKEGVITFVADKAIRINSCKSGKYGNSVIGFEFGKDEKALQEIKDFTASYKMPNKEVQELKIDSLQTYIEIPKQESVTVKLAPNKKGFLKTDEMTFDPNTTMLCVSSRIRLDEYKFEIRADEVIAVNYFGTPQKYLSKESPF